MDNILSAPILHFAPREIVAVEHPMIIKNIDKGLKTFGNGKPFQRILHVDDPEGCLPLYLRQNDPMSVPILSHNSPTNNVLLRITVPKRIGKRKRGSQEPYSEISHSGQSPGPDRLSQTTNLSSAHLSRSLRDSAGQYEVEAVGEIEWTHRFRGLTDFHHSTAHSEFVLKLEEFVLPGEVEKMRDFKFDSSRGWKQNEDFMPPPAHTNQTLPFNWAWHQNPQLTMEVDQNSGEAMLVHNESMKRHRVDYVSADVESVPQSSPYEIPDDPRVCEVIGKLKEVLDERPVWTRRALGNRIGHEKLPVSIMQALHHVAYQFKGGPFRDAVIKYGIDPRTDEKYRRYQTLFFKIYEEAGKGSLKQWKDVRTNIPLSKNAIRNDTTTHIFDGKTLSLDGKVWQLCDVTDPFLVQLIDNSTLREKFEPKSDGYFNNGAWAKIHIIMRTKLIAIRAHVTITDSDLEDAIKIPDVYNGNNTESRHINVPVPDISLDGSITPRMAEDGGVVREKRNKKMGNSRYARISQILAQQTGKTGKRKYVRKKPVSERLEPGELRKKESPFQGVEGPISTITLQNLEGAGTGNESGQGKKRESTSAEYLTAEENADRAGGLGGFDDDDGEEDDNERSAEDDDSEEEEEDEDSGPDGDEEVEDEDEDEDEDGADDREGPGMEVDEEDYDSETANIADFGTRGALRTLP